MDRNNGFEDYYNSDNLNNDNIVNDTNEDALSSAKDLSAKSENGSEPESYGFAQQEENTDNEPFSYYEADYNTSGADYSSGFSDGFQNERQADFYNTNIKKKSRFTVPVYAVAIAVVLTAAVTFAGTWGYNYAKDKVVIENGTVEIVGNDNPGSAVVATATAERDGKKVLTTPEIVDKVGPAVVGIINTAQVSRNDLFSEFFGGGGTSVQESSGSGVIISEDGYIVTNSHVVEGATSLKVIMNTGDEYEATLIGADSRTDLAVIKIEADGLVFAPMGKSSELRVGDTAIAIGNPLGQEFAGTTTQGIISGLNRSVTIENKQLTLIQTDAAINPGNSGGALVDAYGHLIGINTAKISSEALEGLGFAIPIDEAKPIVSELINNGYVTGRPILGIGGRTVTEEDAKAYNLKVGVYVTSMTPAAPAYMAGIKIGDIIVECDGQPVKTVEDINKIKNKYKPGDELKLKVYRQKNYKEITVVLGEELPDAE